MEEGGSYLWAPAGAYFRNFTGILHRTRKKIEQQQQQTRNQRRRMIGSKRLQNGLLVRQLCQGIQMRVVQDYKILPGIITVF